MFLQVVFSRTLYCRCERVPSKNKAQSRIRQNSAKSSALSNFTHNPSVQNQAEHPEVNRVQCVADVHSEWSPGKRTIITSTPKPSCAEHTQVTPAKQNPPVKTNRASKQLDQIGSNVQNRTKQTPRKRHGNQSANATRSGYQSADATRSKYFTASAAHNGDVDSSDEDDDDEDDNADTERTSVERTIGEYFILDPKVTTRWLLKLCLYVTCACPFMSTST